MNVIGGGGVMYAKNISVCALDMNNNSTKVLALYNLKTFFTF